MEAKQTIPILQRQVKAVVSAPTELPLQLRKQTSLWRDAWQRLIRNKLAVAGGVVVLIFLFMAVFANFLAPYPYDLTSFGKAYQPPGGQFLLGSDPLGRDLLSRLIYGARISMTIGLGSQLIVLLIGVPLGAIAGYYGGKIDLYLMRFVDVMYAFPTLLFVILIMTALGAGLLNIFIALGLTSWVTLCRLTRGQFLSLREKEYVLAAHAVGAPASRIIMRHLLPNALTPIIIAITFGIPNAIFTEASLSFIGVGISPPTPSWGQMVGEYQQYIRSYWYLATFPAIAIGLTMLAFSFLGDGLRDALDPQMKR
ncbi:MAG: ABC transporter permease [Chloroflexi bacterium]|nr:ABC transporter permease [Chloroflexota bacterium]